MFFEEYKDNADTIVGNCDTTLFLGGKEKTTLKEMSEILGKETIDLYNTGESRGKEVSHSLNYQKTGKELMSMDEISVMDGSKCILQVRGVRPFLSTTLNGENNLLLEINYKAKKAAVPFTIRQPLLFCLSDCYIFAFGKLFLRLLLRYLQFQDTVLEFSLDIFLRYGITDIEASGHCT